jgi:hypothetical protein
VTQEVTMTILALTVPALCSLLVVACGGTTIDDGRDAGLDSGGRDAGVDAATERGASEAMVAPGSDGAAAVAACDAINMTLIQRYSTCDGRPTALGLAFETLGFVEYGSGPSASGSMLSDLEYACSQVGKDVVAGKVRFDGAKLTACENDIRALTCNYLYGAIVNLPDSCNAVLAGTVSNGGACRMSQECAGNFEQCDDGSQCPGACTGVPSMIAPACLGDGGTGAACSVEQGCDETTGTCVPRWASGPCNTSLDCAGGYQCTNGGAGGDASSYSCVAYKRVGETCSAGTNECSPGTFCDSGACAVWPGTGGACGDLDGETVGCLGGTCTANGADSKGTCVARLPVGSSCTVRQGQSNPCAPGAICLAGKCAALECF